MLLYGRICLAVLLSRTVIHSMKIETYCFFYSDNSNNTGIGDNNGERCLLTGGLHINLALS